MDALLKLLLEVTLAASAMIGTVLLARRALSKRMNSAAMLALWALVLLRLCIPFTITSPVSIADLFPQQAATAQGLGSDAIPSNSVMADTLSADIGATQAETKEASTYAVSPAPVKSVPAEAAMHHIWEWLKTVPWAAILAGLWLAGVVVTLALHIRSASRFARRLHVCKPVMDDGARAAIEAHREALGIRRNVAMIECDAVHAPIVFGYFRPRILIPTRFLHGMDTESLGAILLHELLHIRCHDMLKNYLWLAAKALHWFNPLVWLAYRRYCDDVELRRDAQAAGRLDADGAYRYSESLVMAARFAQTAPPVPSLTVPLFEKRSKLKERVARLTGPRRRNRAAAMFSGVLALLMLVTCFTTACQPTPEEGAVLDKNGEALEDAIRLSGTQIQDFQIPDHWMDFLETGNLAVTIDANVVLPDATSIPVVKAKAKTFTSQEIEKIIGVLADGQNLYEYNEQLTKDEIQQRILECKREKAQLAESTDLGNEHDGTINLELYDQMIEEYELMLEDAPDEITLIPVSSSVFMEDSFVGQTESRETISVDRSAVFEISYSDGVFLDRSYNRTCNETFDGLTLSQEQAVKLASEFIDKLGITGMGIASVATDDSYNNIDNAMASSTEKVPFYQIVFTRTIEGVPTTYECRYMTTENEYANTRYYERIYIFVNDDGVIQFEWYNPLEITEVLNRSVNLKPFSEIMNTAVQQIINENSSFVDKRIDRMKMAVDTVELGMMAIQVQGEADSYLLIPVWDFFGSYLLHYDDPLDWEGMSEDGWMLSDNIAKSFLTINAIDGSIIDRSLGY